MHTHFNNTIAGQNPSSAIDANDTDNGRCPQKDILITLGIGAGLAGSLVTMAIILAAVVIVCCYRQFKKRRLRLIIK